MRRALITGYLIALHLVLAIMLWRTSLPVRLGLKAETAAPSISAQREVYQWRDLTTPAGSAVFLGDSLTERMQVTAITPGAVNFGISRQRTDQLLEWIPSSTRTASAIYLQIGANDFMQGRDAGIGDRMAKISAALPDKPLIWTGIMLAEAADANSAIQRICKARPGCTYVAPIDDPGAFVDGVHLTVTGYEKWAELLRAAK